MRKRTASIISGAWLQKRMYSSRSYWSVQIASLTCEATHEVKAARISIRHIAQAFIAIPYTPKKLKRA